MTCEAFKMRGSADECHESLVDAQLVGATTRDHPLRRTYRGVQDVPLEVLSCVMFHLREHFKSVPPTRPHRMGKSA